MFLLQGFGLQKKTVLHCNYYTGNTGAGNVNRFFFFLSTKVSWSVCCRAENCFKLPRSSLVRKTIECLKWAWVNDGSSVTYFQKFFCKKMIRKWTNNNCFQRWHIHCRFNVHGDILKLFVGRIWSVLCMSTSERVLLTPFAGWNRLFDAKTTISVTNGTK